MAERSGFICAEGHQVWRALSYCHLWRWTWVLFCFFVFLCNSVHLFCRVLPDFRFSSETCLNSSNQPYFKSCYLVNKHTRSQIFGPIPSFAALRHLAHPRRHHGFLPPCCFSVSLLILRQHPPPPTSLPSIFWLSPPPCRPSQPLLDRSIPDFNTFSSVEDWLGAIKMSQYRDNFLNSGFTSLQLVAQMTSEWVHLLVRNKRLPTRVALDSYL